MKVLGKITGCFAGFVWVLLLFDEIISGGEFSAPRELLICATICTLIAIPCLLIGYKEDLKWGPLGFLYGSSRFTKSSRSSMAGSNRNISLSSDSDSSSTCRLPAKLIGLQPNSDSFYQTAEFWTVLAEQCARVVNGGDLVLNFSISKDGSFNISHFDEISDLAQSFFPSIGKTLLNTYSGRDILLIDRSVTDITNTLQLYASLGMVDGDAFPDGGAFCTVRWPSGKCYDISDLV